MKVRASGLGNLMTGKLGLTPNQQVYLNKLNAKINDGKALTENQHIDYGDLLKKREPELSQTAKSFIREIWISTELNRHKEISSKYLDKGITAEEDSIDLLTKQTGTLYFKNKSRKDNNYFSGECDLKNKEKVIDIKTSWDIFTFSVCELTHGNYWQIQAYMDLWSKEEGAVVYCLVDTPDTMIQDEFKRAAWKLNLYDEELPDDFKAKIARNMIFTQDYWNICHSAFFPTADKSFIPIPDEQRLKFFDVPRNQDDIELAYKRVEKAREYYKTITL